MKILVVVDMQNDFIDGTLKNEQGMQIVNNVVKKINQYKENGDLILYTMDTHEENYLETQEGKNLPVAHCIKNTPGWYLNERVDEALPDEAECYVKPTFGSVELAKSIKIAEYNTTIEEIEFVGLCTDICVLSNVALTKAYVPEVQITVDAACCAGVTPESHDTALNAMKMIQVNVVNQGKEPWRK